MDQRVRVFIDFWNFQLEWNKRTRGAKVDWLKMPNVLVQEAADMLHRVGIGDTLVLEETRVYVSINPASPKDARLRKWLDASLDRLPGFRVFTRERRAVARPVRCAMCGYQIDECAECSRPFRHAAEKGIDAAIITDLFSLAWERAFAVAILVSSDADFVPAVERLQEKGFKVINAAWKALGNQLARTCWASVLIDNRIEELRAP